MMGNPLTPATGAGYSTVQRPHRTARGADLRAAAVAEGIRQGQSTCSGGEPEATELDLDGLAPLDFRASQLELRGRTVACWSDLGQ